MKRVGFVIFVIAANVTSQSLGQSKIFFPDSLAKPSVVLENISGGEAFLAIIDESKYLTLANDGREKYNLMLNNFHTSSQVLIDEVPFRRNFSVRVSDDRRYLYYSAKDETSGKDVGKIYDIKSGKFTLIEGFDGNVAGLYISWRTGRISYQVRNEGHSAKLYISDWDGKNSKFIADALSGPWSPDGKWFLARRVSIQNVHPKERLRAGTITEEEFKKIIQQQRSGASVIPLLKCSTTKEGHN